MLFNEVFEKFIEQSPISVMYRGILENIFAAERLDRIFEDAAQRQYRHELMFSTCAELLAAVVSRIRPSVHAAYRAEAEKIAVSVRAVYDKLAGIEPAVSEALVRETARDLAAILDELHVREPGPFPGWEVRIADGNYLAGTQHRLKELRGIGDAALPGHSLAVLNPHRELIEEVVVCEDGHANQKPLMMRLLAIAQPGQCWIADRDFTTCPLLFGLQDQGAYFVIRQHAALQGVAIGRPRRVGRIATGVVYEQRLRLTNRDGREMVVRRVSVVLDQPTRDGDREIHLLTNMPAKVRAGKITTGYLSRWQVESAFQKLTSVLRCEPNTLGYPDAALFAFCLAVVMYNSLRVVIASLRQAHPKVLARSDKTKKPRKFSFYYLADEIAGVWRGMEIAIAAPLWADAFAGKTPREMARTLLWLARKVESERFLTNPYGPQKRRKPKPMTTRGGHVSTQQILQQRSDQP
jgi:DDE family transposase